MRFACALPSCALLLTLLMAGCKPTVPPPQSETATRTEAVETLSASTSVVAPAPTTDGVSMRYACEQGHRVEIVSGNSARVTLADGRVVHIARVADSAPPRYSGEALSFEVGNEGAILGQDEVGGFSCRETD